MTHAVQEQAALPEPRGLLASRTLTMQVCSELSVRAVLLPVFHSCGPE
jgi:hypothetical protein